MAAPNRAEAVSTRVVIAADAAVCYRSLMFYEEVNHLPLLLLRVAMPRPLRTAGLSAWVGDKKTCIYTSGHLTKVVTEAIQGKRLASDVDEQQLGFEHDVQFQSGSFDFEAIDATHNDKPSLMTHVEHARSAGAARFFPVGAHPGTNWPVFGLFK